MVLDGEPGDMSAVAATTVTGANDAGLIRAAREGDTRAFEQLVRAHDEGVLRLAMTLLRSPEDARDVYQEAFLRVYRNLHTFRLECNFSTWLYRIVTNLCLDQLRKRKVRKEEQGVTEMGDRARDLAETLPEPRASSNPLTALMSSEIAGRVETALSQMTERERVVFELRHYHGMRLKMIGDTLGTTEEAAKNCLFRATQKMREALGDLV
jgi:RNA polymerase sigma-70 factor (ECF subfamily)